MALLAKAQDASIDDVIKLSGDPTLAMASVGKDEPIISFPYQYRRTGVLKADVKGYSITVSGVLAPAGAPGYFAGSFMGPKGAGPLWCFKPQAVGGKRETLCLWSGDEKYAAIAPSQRMNPYLWHKFSAATGTFDYAYKPEIELKEVAIPADLRIEYRFLKWRKSVANVEEFAVGETVREIALTRYDDGSARLQTIAGTIRLTPDPADEDRAKVELLPPAKPALP